MDSPLPLSALQPAATAPGVALPVSTPVPSPDMGTAPTDPMIAKLSAMPIVQAIQAGKPGAGYLHENALGQTEEEVQSSLAQMKSIVPQIGLAVYEAEKSGVIVVYNPKEETPATLEKADKAGKIGHYAIPLLGSAHGAHLPTDAAGSMPVDASAMPGAPSALAGGLSAPQGAPAAAAPPSDTPQPAAKPIPAAVQGAMARIRLKSSSNQPPALSALPAQGSIMNGLIKRAV